MVVVVGLGLGPGSSRKEWGAVVQVEEGVGMVTSDWAMKFEPKLFRETGVEWYGKKGKKEILGHLLKITFQTLNFELTGMSWHITVIESLAPKSETNEEEPMIKTDYYVSIMSEQCRQDSKAVAAITKEILMLHKKNNPHMKQYWLRSDQAGCYKSDKLIIPLWSMSQIGDLGDASVMGYIYSEAGAGKSKCDQVKCIYNIFVLKVTLFLFEGFCNYEEPGKTICQQGDECKDCSRICSLCNRRWRSCQYHCSNWKAGGHC